MPLIEDNPYLPAPEGEMNWRHLNRFKNGERKTEFYLTCLQYAQHLWRQSLPARSILCLDRAWGADLEGNEPILEKWPLPYQALLYTLANIPDGVFEGNARVHFQHYADRLGEPRIEQRKWRSWACWALTCQARPDLPPDHQHEVEYPTLQQIGHALEAHGHPGERQIWEQCLSLSS
ncbi:MAG: hypothetical protein AAGB46_11410 [Verrucomicrobiota bacterium]